MLFMGNWTHERSDERRWWWFRDCRLREVVFLPNSLRFRLFSVCRTGLSVTNETLVVARGFFSLW